MFSWLFVVGGIPSCGIDIKKPNPIESEMRAFGFRKVGDKWDTKLYQAKLDPATTARFVDSMEGHGFTFAVATHRNPLNPAFGIISEPGDTVGWTRFDEGYSCTIIIPEEGPVTIVEFIN